MSNAIRCIDQRFAFKNYGISCFALIFHLNNPRMTVLYAKKFGWTAKYDESYTVFSRRSIRIHGLVVQVSCIESDDLGSIPVGYWNLLCHSFAWISSVVISRWQSCNLNKTIWLSLFWRTWTRARASTALAHMCWPGTWAEIIAIAEPRSWLTARSVASFFPDFSKIQTKRKSHTRLF